MFQKQQCLTYQHFVCELNSENRYVSHAKLSSHEYVHIIHCRVKRFESQAHANEQLHVNSLPLANPLAASEVSPGIRAIDNSWWAAAPGSLTALNCRQRKEIRGVQ